MMTCGTRWPVDPTVTVRIGTSGWYYDHWTDVLYPRGLPSAPTMPLPASAADLESFAP